MVVPGMEEGSSLFYALTGKARSAARPTLMLHGNSPLTSRTFCSSIRTKGKGYEIVELWINSDVRSSATFAQVESYGRAMTEAAEKLVHVCQELWDIWKSSKARQRSSAR